MEEKKQNRMGTAAMIPLIASMSIPTMFSMLIQSLYNVVDSIFVSHINENALTAVSLAFPLQTLILAVAVGTGMGMNSLISRRLGERNFKDANSAAAHGMLLALISYAVFAIIGFFVAYPFFELFSKDTEVIEMGVSYIRIVLTLSFGVFLAVNNEKIIQATGNAFLTMLCQLFGALTNIAFDPLLIFGYWGFPKMGVAGAALATVLGQVVSMVLSFILLLRRVDDVKITFKGFRFKMRIIKDIYAVGFPSIIMQSITSLLTMGLNGILSGFSGAAVSVLGVYYKLQSFIFMPVFGLTQGIMPIIGYNFGAGNRKRLMSALKIGMLVALVIMIIGFAIFLICPALLLNMFNATDEMMRIGIHALRTICWGFIPAGFSIIFSTCFQAVGSGFYSLFVSLLRQMFVILPAAYLFARFLGLDAFWYAFPIAEIAGLVATLFLFRSAYRKKISKMPEHSSDLNDMIEEPQES